MIRNFLLLLTLIIISSTLVYAQEEEREEVVHLKNGGEIRGCILEYSGHESLLIRLHNRKKIRVTTDQIERISSEPLFLKKNEKLRRAKFSAGNSLAPLIGIGNYRFDLLKGNIDAKTGLLDKVKNNSLGLFYGIDLGLTFNSNFYIGMLVRRNAQSDILRKELGFCSEIKLSKRKISPIVLLESGAAVYSNFKMNSKSIEASPYNSGYSWFETLGFGFNIDAHEYAKIHFAFCVMNYTDRLLSIYNNSEFLVLIHSNALMLKTGVKFK